MTKHFSYNRLSRFSLFVAVVLLSALSELYAQQPNIIYLYDDLGRLVQVVNQNNECATYEYDAVGNILSITRNTNCLQPPAINSLFPDSTNAGTSVCIAITGTNFSGGNLTTDNPGIKLNRVSVSDTTIEACLDISFFAPAGPTKIIVTTAGGSADRTFTVGARVMVVTQDTSIDENNKQFENATVEVSGKTLVVDGAHTFANLTLRNGAVLTHSPTTATSVKKLDISVAGTLTVDATSRIDVTSRGFLGGFQSGNPFGIDAMTVGFQRGSHLRSGGSYGGLGGSSEGSPNPVYGDFRDPNDPGSGGGSFFASPRGGNGGGLIRIVAQTIRLDGSIVANGGDGEFDAAGGSGGGIRVDVGTLLGTGQIRANGGNGDRGAGGGGGRVAVYYQDVVGFDLTKVTTFGGTDVRGQQPNGGAGTIYLQGPARENGELIADNNNLGSITQSTPIPATVSNLSALTNLRVRRAAKVRVDDQLNLASVLEVSFGGEFIPVKRVIASTISVNNSAVITQLPTTGTASFKVDLNANAITIDVTSKIDATSRGFLGGFQSGNPFGIDAMTVGFQRGSHLRSGGSYGGLGGSAEGSPNPVYGDFRDPNDPGSGGGSSFSPPRGGNGGGLIRIVAQTIQLDGSIVANGGDGEFDAAAGSGGGIRVDVGTLQGTGQIRANGGNGDRGAGGGGGRVAVYYQDVVGFDLTKVTAFGGTDVRGQQPNGQNGTVLTQQRTFP